MKQTGKLFKIKKNLNRTRGITQKRARSGGAQLLGLALEQHSFEEVLQRWRASGDTAYDLTDPEIKLPDLRHR